MNRQPSPIRRLLSLALAVVFLFGTGVQAAGLQHCPMHDASAGGLAIDAPTPTAGHGEPAAHGGTSHQHTSGASHDRSSCTCLGGCDAQVSASAPETGLGLLSLLPPPETLPVPEAEGSLLQGPRHDLFELHRPNAPPPSIPS